MLVPRPISSSTTRLRSVAWWRMLAVSSISTMKVLWPVAMSSCAPMRVKMRSTSPIRARSAGTNEPIWAISTISATWRSQRALAGHVRPGQDDDLGVVGIEMGVVRHVLAAAQHRLEGRVAAGDDLDRAAVVQLRPDVVARAPRPRPGSQTTSSVRDRLRPPPAAVSACPATSRHHPPEDIRLDLGQRVLRGQDDRFVLLELRGEVAGGVGQRLLRDVVGGQRPASFDHRRPPARSRSAVASAAVVISR